MNLGTGTATDGFGAIDTLSSIEGVEGSAFDDTLIGGADDLFESFIGGAGSDSIDGGTGFDRINYFADLAGVTVNLVDRI